MSVGGAVRLTAEEFAAVAVLLEGGPGSLAGLDRPVVAIGLRSLIARGLVEATSDGFRMVRELEEVVQQAAESNRVLSLVRHPPGEKVQLARILSGERGLLLTEETVRGVATLVELDSSQVRSTVLDAFGISGAEDGGSTGETIEIPIEKVQGRSRPQLPEPLHGATVNSLVASDDGGRLRGSLVWFETPGARWLVNGGTELQETLTARRVDASAVAAEVEGLLAFDW